jgi:hypothetical protein
MTYEQVTNEELGWWLERVLYAANDCKGDSPKVHIYYSSSSMHSAGVH